MLAPPPPQDPFVTPLNTGVPPKFSSHLFVTPKFDPRTPLPPGTIKRKPLLGEVAISLQGSPLQVSPPNTFTENVEVRHLQGHFMALFAQQRCCHRGRTVNEYRVDSYPTLPHRCHYIHVYVTKIYVVYFVMHSVLLRTGWPDWTLTPWMTTWGQNLLSFTRKLRMYSICKYLYIYTLFEMLLD